MANYLAHHGVIGQKWGLRRYQNEDGTYTKLGLKRLKTLDKISKSKDPESGYQKLDAQWARKNYDAIMKDVKGEVTEELGKYTQELMSATNYLKSNGQLSAATVNAYNRKMAELMNTAASDIVTPSGQTVKFIAKRGEMGVHMALASAGYDMSDFKNGVWGSGRVAYRKNTVNMA